MQQKVLPVQFQRKMVEEIELFIEDGLYTSKAELVRDAVREKIIELRKARAANALATLRSQVKEKPASPFVPEKVKDAVFRDYVKKKGLKL